MLGNYRVAAQLVASRVVLSSTELVSVYMYVCMMYVCMYVRGESKFIRPLHFDLYDPLYFPNRLGVYFPSNGPVTESALPKASSRVAVSLLSSEDGNMSSFWNVVLSSYLEYRLNASWRIPSFWMLRRVDLVRTDVSEEPSASIIGVSRIGELTTTLAVTSNRRTLRRNT
jgi:hypothetical protein